MTYWAIKWRSNNKLDGYREHWIFQNGETGPKLFQTRRAARKYSKHLFGYMASRPDLKAEPHGWKTPQVLKVNVHLEPC